MLVAGRVEIDVVLFVCVAAVVKVLRSDWLTVVAAVDEALHWLAPPAAAMEGASVAPERMVPDPPSIHNIGIRAVAVTILIGFVSIG